MCQFAGDKIDFICPLIDLIVTEIGVKNIVGCFDDLHTCLVAELTGHISVLSGEGEDNIHHNEGRYERKWFQYCPQHSDSPP